MVRTQIQLTEKQAEGLKRRALERGVSMAEIVREALDRALGDDERRLAWDRALSAVGKYRDRFGATDVAEKHDEYLAEALLDWRR